MAVIGEKRNENGRGEGLCRRLRVGEIGCVGAGGVAVGKPAG